MSSIVERLDKTLYPDYAKNWDDVLFRQRILKEIRPEFSVLDLGAGAGIVEAMNFKGHARWVCGVDLDPRVVDNPFLDEGRVADAGLIPYPDESFDLVFSDNVLEHLEQPQQVFAEVARVLKPGGCFLFKTPNKSHDMPLIARLTPHKFHQYVNRLRGRKEVDTFPTLYKANSIRDIRRIATRTGFTVSAIERIEGRPEYLRISWPTYLIGAAYERLVNVSERLAMFRILIIAQLRKPDDANRG
jgi:SAM-dependent methyltransferase